MSRQYDLALLELEQGHKHQIFTHCFVNHFENALKIDSLDMYLQHIQFFRL